MTRGEALDLMKRYTALLETCGGVLFRNGLLENTAITKLEVELLEIQALALLVEENYRLRRERSNARQLAFFATCGTLSLLAGDLLRFVAGLF